MLVRNTSGRPSAVEVVAGNAHAPDLQRLPALFGGVQGRRLAGRRFPQLLLPALVELAVVAHAQVGLAVAAPVGKQHRQGAVAGCQRGGRRKTACRPAPVAPGCPACSCPRENRVWRGPHSCRWPRSASPGRVPRWRQMRCAAGCRSSVPTSRSHARTCSHPGRETPALRRPAAPPGRCGHHRPCPAGRPRWRPSVRGPSVLPGA